MKVLVTGGATPLGGAVIARLLDAPTIERVLAIGGAHRRSAKLDVVEVDLTRPRDVHDLIHGPARALGVTAIVHAPPHATARDGGARVRAENVEATRALLLACERHPTIERFVYRSAAEVYAVRTAEPNLLDEDAPLELHPAAPQWVRDRVEADLLVSARIGVSDVAIDVLRCAEVLAAGTGSQLWDYLQSRLCLRPLGFDPMVNVLSVDDAVAATTLAVKAGLRGVHNIPGADTLPLSALIRCGGRVDLPLPGPALAPLYNLRAWATGHDFRYDLNARRFHLGGVLDGARAARELGYRPSHPCARGSPGLGS